MNQNKLILRSVTINFGAIPVTFVAYTLKVTLALRTKQCTLEVNKNSVLLF